MAKSWEKSLAVESMHRMVKHFKDVSENKVQSLSEEVFDIMMLWDLREECHFDLGEGDLNHYLKKIDEIKKDPFLITRNILRDTRKAYNEGYKALPRYKEE